MNDNDTKIIKKIFKQIPEITRIVPDDDYVDIYIVDKDYMRLNKDEFDSVIDILKERTDMTLDDFKEAMFLTRM